MVLITLNMSDQYYGLQKVWIVFATANKPNIFKIILENPAAWQQDDISRMLAGL